MKDIRWKQGEKAVFKELNQDISIKFPVKANIASNAHKVTLLVQAELGGVEFPLKDKNKYMRAQLIQDTALVFQHINRLIRCVIDCQLTLEDSIAVRNALELARSIGAKVWDNSPQELRQLEQIGSAAIRKLAGCGINSIEKLEASEAHKVESALVKHPPFGMRILAQAANFPKLHVSLKAIGRDRKPGVYLKVRVRAEVGFINDKPPTFFRRKQVYVCFFAETSNGVLVEFRRWAATKVGQNLEVLFTADLKQFCTHITCYVMCDEIAGTSRSASLELNIAKDEYPPDRAPQIAMDARVMEIDDFDDFDDGLDDSDLMDVPLPSQSEQAPSIRKPAAHEEAAKVPDDSPAQPVKLPNGNFACNHKCSDKSACQHNCCKEGTSKPPRSSKPKKRKQDDDQHPQPSKQTKLMLGTGPSQSMPKKSGVVATRIQGHTISDRDLELGRIIPSTQVAKPQESRQDNFQANPYGMADLSNDLWPGNDTGIDELPDASALLKAPVTRRLPLRTKNCHDGKKRNDEDGTTLVDKPKPSQLSNAHHATADGPKLWDDDLDELFNFNSGEDTLPSAVTAKEKSLFVTGDSSSPEKTTQKRIANSTKMKLPETAALPSDEMAAIDAALYGNSDSDFDVFDDDDRLFHDRNDPMINDRSSSTVKADSISPAPVDAAIAPRRTSPEPATIDPRKLTIEKENFAPAEQPGKKEKDAERLAWEAEQEKLWAPVDPALWEYIRDHVEII